MTNNNENEHPFLELDLHTIERNISSIELIARELQDAVQKIKQKEEDIKKNTADFTEKEAEYQRRIQDERIRITNLEKENEELKNTSSTHEEKYMQLEKKLQEIRNTLVKSELRQDKYKEQNQKCLSDKEKHEIEISQLKEIRDKLTANEARLNSEIRCLKEEIERNQDTVSQLRSTENLLNFENKELEEKNAELELLSCQNLERQIKDTATIEELEKKLQARQEVTDTLEVFIANQCEIKAAKIQGLEEELNVLKETKLRDDVSSKHEIRQYHTENEALRNEIEGLRKQLLASNVEGSEEEMGNSVDDESTE